LPSDVESGRSRERHVDGGPSGLLVPDDTFLDPGAEDYAMTLLDVVVIRHLTGQAETRYRSPDTALIPNQNRMSTCQ